jgi:hypothetical protein
MNNLPIGSISQMEEFLKNNSSIKMEIEGKRSKYEFIKQVLLKTRYTKYNTLSKKEKIIIIKYLVKLVGYSKGHIKKLIQKLHKGLLVWNSSRNRNRFPIKYSPEDIQRLIETDVAHECLNGKTTKDILRRQFEVFGDNRFENISKISISHLYNIRNGNRQYGGSEALYLKHTQAVQTKIGIRRKPQPCGKPGFLRIDTVHQGDRDKVKGVYHINIVDEVTQYEMIATIEKISERFLKPIIEELLHAFPFMIYEFHSDNGSEYVNHSVARLLNKIHIEFTKSRSRHSNDNALVESKNGSIIRKLFGRNFINQKYAKIIDVFNRKYVNNYLIYHRPCLFTEEQVDKLGKIRKKYNTVMTPYEKLKFLENAEQYLKPGFSFEKLDKIAYTESDNEWAEKMRKAKMELFEKIKNN